MTESHPGRWILTTPESAEALIRMLKGQGGQMFEEVKDLIYTLDEKIEKLSKERDDWELKAQRMGAWSGELEAEIKELQKKATKYDALMKDAGLA